MFEGLLTQLQVHAATLNDNLTGIGRQLATIAGNTEAALARNQWVRKSAELAKKGETVELRNNDAYGWLIRSVATSAAKVQINLLSQNESGLAWIGNAAGERENTHWYVPPGGVVFVKSLEEGEGAKVVFVNFDIELLVTSSDKGHSGKNSEHIDVPTVPPIPSGHPLDEPQLPAGVRS